ncbi:MAG TPA: DUF1573 domain-containing protein [Pirellulaceae bacterium]|nr:DUF1573 domain-containing protein [Pirellulaceae bacterium]
MLGRTLVFLGGGVLLVGGLTAIAASNVTFLYDHPRAPDARIIVDSKGARIDLEAVKRQVAKETGVAGLPRAAVLVTDYDFGTMDPLTSGTYDFEIKNVGDAPLHLKLGPTSCKCTLSGLSADKLPPGATGKIRLEWFTGRQQTRFEQTAVLYSNDPTQKHIALGVSGKVRMLVGFDQEQLVVDRLEPDKSVTKEVLVYSQMWEQFEVIEFGTSLAGVTFASEPVAPADAGDLEALSVQRIKVTIPGTLPQGEFSDTLRFRVQPPDADAKPVDVTVPLHGRVLRRLSIYGQGILGEGIIEMGTVPRGVGKTINLVVKVRDPQVDLSVRDVQITPQFLKASLQPREKDRISGLYDLAVELPDDIEPCTYLGNPSGELRIDFDHPRIEDLTLDVHFAVAP